MKDTMFSREEEQEEQEEQEEGKHEEQEEQEEQEENCPWKGAGLIMPHCHC